MRETTSIKDELAHLKPRKKCDRLAELSALVRMTGAIHLKRDGLDLTLSSSNPAVARKTLLLLKNLFDIDTGLATEQPSAGQPKPVYVITVPAQTALVYTLKKSRILDEDSHLLRGAPWEILKDKCCQAAYMRGVFLAAGSLAASEHGYHLEMATANETMAEDLLTLTEELGFPGRLNERKKDFAVYLTDADSVTDFLALIGAHAGVLELENLRILRALKSEVNRVVNAETANLRKTAAAGVTQISDIKLIDREIGLDSLPAALRDVARTRLKHPNATIAELGTTFHPPLSKSAVNHRLRRLHAIAAGLAR
jgi:cell division protein WhiA